MEGVTESCVIRKYNKELIAEWVWKTHSKPFPSLVPPEIGTAGVGRVKYPGPRDFV